MTGVQQRIWRQLLAQSFEPSQWYSRDDKGVKEDGIMWVYRTHGLYYVVGFYDPAGVWNQDSRHDTKEEAAERVHYLNGGG